MSDHPVLVAGAFGFWSVAGLVLSVRQSARGAGEGGRSETLGGFVGVPLASPPEVSLTGPASLAVVVWGAVWLAAAGRR